MPRQKREVPFGRGESLPEPFGRAAGCVGTVGEPAECSGHRGTERSGRAGPEVPYQPDAQQSIEDTEGKRRRALLKTPKAT
jgi:hypothetical protein